jgi:hypothetical protein
MSEQIYISLGYNCGPRIYMKTDLHINMATGYLTCPFDLCITKFDALYNCIETDFKYFFDELKLIPGGNADGDRSLCGPGGMNITNYYNIIFNHEGSTHSHLFKTETNNDLFYIQNDYEEFKKRYTARITNFKKDELIDSCYIKIIDHNVNIIEIRNFEDYILLKKDFQVWM